MLRQIVSSCACLLLFTSLSLASDTTKSAKACPVKKADAKKECPAPSAKAEAQTPAAAPAAGQPAQAETPSTAASATAPMQSDLVPQKTCPVMGGAINKKLYVDWEGKRIYVCCKGCIADVKKDPAKYIKVLEERGEKVEETAKK